MMTMLKTTSALISASFLLVIAPAVKADNFSISIGYSSFGHHGRLPYSYKPFSHPKTIYYSPLRVYHYSKPYPKHYYHYSPGYKVKHHYHVPKPYHYDRKHNHRYGYGQKHHYDRGHKKYYYKNSYRGSYQKIPQKIYKHRK